MKKIIILSLVLLPLLSTASNEYRGRDNRGNDERNKIERLENKIYELREQIMKYDLCVRGLAQREINFGGSKFSSGAAFAQGNFSKYDMEHAKATAIISENSARCSAIPSYIEGLE